MDANSIDFSGRYRSATHPGVAFYLLGWEQRWEPCICFCEDDDGNEWEEEVPGEGEWVDDIDGSRVRAVMVGDDREWLIDVSDIDTLDDDQYCSCCGQIGCGWS